VDEEALTRCGAVAQKEKLKEPKYFLFHKKRTETVTSTH
jgi:hypothetical protein